MIVNKIDSYIAAKDRTDFKSPIGEAKKMGLVTDAAEALANSIKRQLLPSVREPRGGGKLYPSEATKCARQLLYKFMEVPSEPLNANAVMKFLMGDLIEASFVLAAGLTGRAIENNNIRLEIMIGGHPRGGRIDGTTKKPSRRVVEIKSMGSWGFKDFCENGLTDDFGYLGQLNVYIRQCLKDRIIDKPQALYLAMNKDNQNIEERLINYDPAYAEFADKNFTMVEDFARRHKVMKRPVKYSTNANKAGEHKVLTGLLTNTGELPLGCGYCPLKYTCWVKPVQMDTYDDEGTPLYSQKPTQHVERTFQKNWKGGFKPVHHLVDTDVKKHELTQITEAGNMEKW